MLSSQRPARPSQRKLDKQLAKQLQKVDFSDGRIQLIGDAVPASMEKHLGDSVERVIIGKAPADTVDITVIGKTAVIGNTADGKKERIRLSSSARNPKRLHIGVVEDISRDKTAGSFEHVVAANSNQRALARIAISAAVEMQERELYVKPSEVKSKFESLLDAATTQNFFDVPLPVSLRHYGDRATKVDVTSIDTAEEPYISVDLVGQDITRSKTWGTRTPGFEAKISAESINPDVGVREKYWVNDRNRSSQQSTSANQAQIQALSELADNLLVVQERQQELEAKLAARQSQAS